MKAAGNSLSEPRELSRLLLVYWRRWVVATLLITAIAAGYAAVAPKTWQAAQALIVRSEAGATDSQAGSSRTADDQKSIEETVAELAKSRDVLQSALVQTGPPADRAGAAAWPSDKDISALQKAAKIVPPKGVEFGSSEVFYLEVLDKDRVRAMALSAALEPPTAASPSRDPRCQGAEHDRRTDQGRAGGPGRSDRRDRKAHRAGDASRQ